MQTVKVLESHMEDRQNVAREHSALFPTRLALARWCNGDLPHPHHAHQPPLRAAWLAKAQRDFQAWLENGGFAQHDQPCLSASAGGSRHPGEWMI